MKRWKRVLTTASLALAVAGFMAPETRAQGIEVGMLNCEVAGGVGFVFGSSKALTCVFDGAASGREVYEGSINKFGVDIGVTGNTYIAWAVFAATADIPPGALEGTYAGATGEATVGVGAGANVLVGGSGDSISLQPVSVQAQTGLNVAAGIASVNLRLAQ